MKNTQDFFYIKQILNGDVKSFSYLVEKYKDFVFTISYRILKNKEDAEEIAQDSFIKAYKELKNFRGDAKFSTWLYTITYRLTISKLRKNKINFNELTDITIDTYKDEFSLSQLDLLKYEEQKKYINLALEKLPELDSLLLTLYYLNENSIEEIHQITELSISNVKVKLFRARKRIYKELEVLLKSELKSIL